MIIDFNNTDLPILPEFKGGEKHLAANKFFDGTTGYSRAALFLSSDVEIYG